MPMELQKSSVDIFDKFIALHMLNVGVYLLYVAFVYSESSMVSMSTIDEVMSVYAN